MSSENYHFWKRKIEPHLGQVQQYFSLNPEGGLPSIEARIRPKLDQLHVLLKEIAKETQK